jgi:hypothetical protein
MLDKVATNAKPILLSEMLTTGTGEGFSAGSKVSTATVPS